ncbi:hypothetical protein FMEXI_14473 [Fusarium mexicanum]|uniref:Uncharacterized protein n=1 Tax=Fusarium mexicanum TaxID=751941 RepID=A0A8H5I3W5_9HYPO|nr:hypothetical protein FMEXI_14473 [Fusarium mexicanum]
MQHKASCIAFISSLSHHHITTHHIHTSTMTNSYLPASFTGILSWPVRRDDAPQSKSDSILTMGIVGGIILLFIVPPTWYFIARTIRLRRARLKGKDVEQGVQSSQ